MLILTRKIGESIVIDGRIVVTFMGHKDPKHNSPIRIGISAPDDVPVMRQELLGLEEARAKAERFKGFQVWLEQCAEEALSSEWCIDPTWPRWRELFEARKTPQEAVDALFEEIKAT